MKILFLPIGMAVVLIGVVTLGCVLGLAGILTGAIVGLGVGLGGAVIGATVGLCRLGAHVAGPLLVIAGILVLVKLLERT